MTELSTRSCLRSQLPGVVGTRHGTVQGVSLPRNIRWKGKERYIVIPNLQSFRKPHICICINGFESQGFVHKSFVSRECSEHCQIHVENKKLKYFALLKEYISSVTSIKNIIGELESFSEEQCNDDMLEKDRRYSCDLSKVLNILERYRSDMKHIKNLEVPFQSFLKSEILYLSQTVGLTLKGFSGFIASVEHQVLQIVYTILKKELQDLIRYTIYELRDKDSSWNPNSIHLCQLAGKFEKLASAVTSEFEKWRRTWKERVALSVSKRGGVRSEFPLMYLKKLGQPYLHSYIKTWLLSMNSTDNLASFINARALRVSNNCLGMLYFQLFRDEQFWELQRTHSRQQEREGNVSAIDSKNEEKLKNSHKKSLAITIKSFRSKFFQEFWEEAQKEEPLITTFVATLCNSNLSLNKLKSVNLVVDHGKRIIDIDPEKQKSFLQNGLSTSIDINKAPGASKKVQWDDMVNQNLNKDAIESHMNTMWKSVSKYFVNQFCYRYIFCDQESLKWDFSITTMDPERASVVLSCLSVKKLRSDSGNITPAFNQCVRNISAHVTLLNYMQRWDEAIRNVHTSAIKDKCRIAPSAVRKHSDTMSLIIDALQPVQKCLALLVSSRGSDMQKLDDTSEYDRIFSMTMFALSSVLRSAIDWLQTKSHQFLSSGSWEQYLVITSDDTAALQDKLRLIVPHVVTLSKKTHLVDKPNLMIQNMLESIQKMFAAIAMIRSTKNDVWVSNVKIRAKRALRQHFPDAKQWRKRGATRIPFEANSYVKVLPNQVLAPVIESTRALDKEEADEILCECFSAFVKSLMGHILETSIKFSYYGANQLGLDFNCFRDWVARLEPQYMQGDTISKILADDSFEEFRSAIKLLCCQPESRRRSTAGSVSDTDGASSIGSSTSQGSYNGSIFEPTINQIEVKNKEKWLSLRVKGGQAKTRLLCINSS